MINRNDDVFEWVEADRARELIRLNIQLEHRINERGDLEPLPGITPALFIIAQHCDGDERYYRSDLPAEVRLRLAELSPEVALHEHDRVCEILAAHARCADLFAGIGYYFDRHPSPDECPDVIRRGASYAIVINGRQISRAWSERDDEYAAELAVETQREYRQRGYARQVAAAWAADVLDSGRVAFYSHRTVNAASKALARSLGVVPYAVLTSYESYE